MQTSRFIQSRRVLSSQLPAVRDTFLYLKTLPVILKHLLPIPTAQQTVLHASPWLETRSDDGCSRPAPCRPCTTSSPPRLTSAAAAAPGRPRNSGSPPGGTARAGCSGLLPCTSESVARADRGRAQRPLKKLVLDVQPESPRAALRFRWVPSSLPDSTARRRRCSPREEPRSRHARGARGRLAELHVAASCGCTWPACGDHVAARWGCTWQLRAAAELWQ